jgi:spore maturation protein CgeB
MSNKLEKKTNTTLKKQETSNEIIDINHIISIYENQLNILYQSLSRKTSKTEWVDCNFPNLLFNYEDNSSLPKNWLLPSENNRKKTLSTNKNEELCIKTNLTKGDSFYLQTGNLDINTPPTEKTAWAISRNRQHQIHVDATYGEERLNCAIFIIQYDEKKRLTTKFQEIYQGKNKIDFITTAESKYISIAFRFKGAGELRIKPIKIIAEEMLPNNQMTLNNNMHECHNILEKRAQELYIAFKNKINALPDAPILQKNKNDELKSKLATALYEKRKIEKSLNYRLGKTIAEIKNSNLLEILKVPQKLIKIRAAQRKGKFNFPALNKKIQEDLLASVGIFEDNLDNKEITWPAFEPKAKLRNQEMNVVCITDKFTYECFRYEANFIPLSKDNWQAEIDSNKPSMFFIESAWNGNNGEWMYTMASYKKHLGEPLRNAIAYCKSLNIPVVFWNKEDPTNYDVFIDVAADCDYIFTTDGNLIEKYIARVGHNRIYPLAFAAQPAIHNPIRDKRKKLPLYDICFAGSWYNQAHDTRRVQTEIVLDGAMKKHQLHIYDRMLHAEKHRESRIFPLKYQPFIVGSLNYEQMITAYRQYKVFLNINTVQDSPTMFSRRVFELLACGTPVISTPSIGMEEMLGEHVHIVKNHEDTESKLNTLLSSDIERERLGHLAARFCLQKHSYQQRFAHIASTVGLDMKEGTGDLVSVIMCTNRPKNIEIMLENYKRQNHNNKELIIILNNDEYSLVDINLKLKNIPNSRAFQLSQDKTLGDCLNEGVKHAKGDYIAKLDDDDIYGVNYLTDALLAFNFSGADIVGKDTFYCYFESKNIMVIKRENQDNRYSDFVAGATLVIKRAVFEKVQFHSRNRGEDTNFLKDCKDNNFIIYSSDKYNFINMRYANVNMHTWTIDDEENLKNCTIIQEGYNNALSGI